MLHGDAECCSFSIVPGQCHDKKLRTIRILVQVSSAHVSWIEGGFNLVQNDQRNRFDLQDGGQDT